MHVKSVLFSLFSLFFTKHDIDTAAVVCFSGFSDAISSSSVDNFTFVRNLTVQQVNTMLTNVITCSYVINYIFSLQAMRHAGGEPFPPIMVDGTKEADQVDQ